MKFKKLVTVFCGLVVFGMAIGCSPTLHAHTLVHHDAVASTCIQAGTIEYWSCSGCEKLFGDDKGTKEISSIVAPLADHNLKKTDKVDATCTEKGNIEYWTCKVCSKKFSDAQATTEVSNVEIAAKGHTLVKHDAVPAIDCQHEGTIEYWSCSSCSKKFADATASVVITDISDHTKGDHDCVYHAPVAGKDCQSEGTIEYWACNVCSKKFAEEGCITEVDDISDHAKGEHAYVTHDAKEATCVAKGNELYYTCSVECCDKIFNALKEEISEVPEIDIRAHVSTDLTHHDAEPGSDCQHKGIIEHWTCNTCAKLFSDENGQNEISSAEGTEGAHSYVTHAAKAATCSAKGNDLYYTCSVEGCDKIFDEDYQLIDAIPEIDIRAHIASDLTHHDAQPGADCQHAGTIEHWTCNTCSKMFSDENGTSEISSATGPVGSHTYVTHAAKAATCNEGGNDLYYTCSVEGCDKIFDADYEEIASAPTFGPRAHVAGDLTHHAAEAGTCQVKGTIEHWTCNTCSKLFSDANGTTEISSAEGSYGAHDLEHHDAVPGTCVQKGTIEYWSCKTAGCGKLFSDAEGKNIITSIEGSYGAHDLEHHTAVTATCETGGNKEYWSCKTEGCGKLFLDSEAKTETTLAEVTIGALGHDMAKAWSTDESKHWHKCNREGCTHIEDEALHTFGDWIIDEVASWPDKGSKHRLCSVCEYREDAEIDPTLTAAMVMEAIDNIPVCADYKATYNGLMDPFVKRAYSLYNDYITNGGSASDITNLGKLTSSRDTLTNYNISADNYISASIFSKGNPTNNPIKDNINMGYKFVTNATVKEYSTFCSFDKTKVTEDIKAKLSGATSLSFGLKVSGDISVQPQLTYTKEDSSTGYKVPSGVGVTKAGEWLLLTLDSSWIDLIVSDSLKLFYITCKDGQAAIDPGFELTVADMYIDKTIVQKNFVSEEGWTRDGNGWSYAASGSITPYDTDLFDVAEISAVQFKYLNDYYSKLSQLTAKSDIASNTVVYCKGAHVNGTNNTKFMFYVSGEITVSGLTFYRGNDITTAASEDLISDQPVTYTTGWHSIDATASTQWFGYMKFTISNMSSGSSMSILVSGSLIK